MFKLPSWRGSRKRNRNRAVSAPAAKPAPNKVLEGQGGAAKPGIQKRLFGNFFDGVDWGRARINIVVVLFCVLWLGLWGRAWYLQMIAGPRLASKAERQHMTTELVAGRRGMILDRNGQVLARSVEALSVYANPREIKDFLKMANTLGPILGQEPQKLYDELSRTGRRFIWLKRKVDDKTAEAVRKAAIEGIGLSKEFDRVYPFTHMAGQLLGFVGLDDKGLEGLERSLEARLGSIPTRRVVQRDATGRRFYLDEEGNDAPHGEDVTLTLNAQIQFIAEDVIAAVAREYDARWAGALVVDVPSGDILAWAQYPFFNPNNYRETSPAIYRNRLAADALEPGSTFKPFVIAAALQEGKITPTTPIDCEKGRWETKRFSIRDTSVQGIIPVNKVLRYSSNIGMAKIGLELGARVFHDYLRKLGFGERTSVPVSESRGILRPPRDWSEVDIMSTAFGQSISVTCLQMAQASLTLLNNGVYNPLRLLRDNGIVQETYQRVFNERVCRQVMEMMRDVVESKDGTGRRARIEGVDVGGKTGTAQQADLRTCEYGSKRTASFAGFVPASHPRYLIFIMVDEPTRNQYGGVVAAAAFRDMAARALILNGTLGVAETAEKKESAHPAMQGRPRSLKVSREDIPYMAENGDVPAASGMRLPGHLSRASSKVPDVKGKSVRYAVELFARAGVVPELKGSGTRVVKQSPQPGTPWPEEGKAASYILWLSEK